MVFGKRRKKVGVLWVILFFWVVINCAHQQPPVKDSREESTPAVVTKIKASVEPAPELPAHKPEMPVEPKVETNKVSPGKPVSNTFISAPAKSGLYAHKVRWPEETLSHISKWYTGSVKNWKTIARANPDLDPKKIDTGDTIFIPENLLTSRKPMPHSFLFPSVRKKVKPPLLPSKTATPSDAPKLFGPIYIESLPVEPDAAKPKLFGPVE